MPGGYSQDRLFQVVGAAHCIKSLFSQPLAITLQSGKFILREYGRYILVSSHIIISLNEPTVGLPLLGNAVTGLSPFLLFKVFKVDQNA